METLWHHSLSVAVAAKETVLMESEENNLAEESFVAGMLHDTGQLILCANSAEQYQHVFDLAREEMLDIIKAEERVFAGFVRGARARDGGHRFASRTVRFLRARLQPVAWQCTRPTP